MKTQIQKPDQSKTIFQSYHNNMNQGLKPGSSYFKPALKSQSSFTRKSHKQISFKGELNEDSYCLNKVAGIPSGRINTISHKNIISKNTGLCRTNTSINGTSTKTLFSRPKKERVQHTMYQGRLLGIVRM